MPLDKIRAPYGFVPLSNDVVFPEWSQEASRDWPFEDGLCGHLDIEIEAMSPIFVRGTAKEKDPLFFRAPNGQVGIPGSSLRGMLRNTLEIATFAKFNRFDDRKYGVRDLHNRDVYGDHMAAILPNAQTGKKEPMPLVNAGWLIPNDGPDSDVNPAIIEPCDFAKLEYGILANIAGALKVKPGFDPGRRQSAPSKYSAWVDANGRDAGSALLNVAALRENHGDKRLVSTYGKVTGPGKAKGTIVFTGQPSAYDSKRVDKRSGAGNPKHHDFFFHGPATPQPQMKVSADDFKNFEFIHSDGGEQHRLTGRLKANEEWAFWRKRSGWEGPPNAGRRVPVFFLRKPDGSLRAFGLAMMFRLAYDKSIGDAVGTSQLGFTDAKADFVETLFGRVPDRKNRRDTSEQTLKGRIGVGFGPAVGTPKTLSPVRVVLGTPKASFYPNYVEQNPEVGHGEGPNKRFRTFMDAAVRIRGWKRYRPLQGHKTITPPDPKRGDGSAMNLDKVATEFTPLAPGTRFQARIRLHNAKPEELGALLWALDFGGTPDTFHRLGLGRSLGYGTVRLKLVGSKLEDVNEADVTPTRCLATFRKWIDTKAPGWEQRPQIRELVALARPMPAEDARHMQINHPTFRNEFSEAKKEFLALPRAATDAPRVPLTAAKGPSTAVAATRVDSVQTAAPAPNSVAGSPLWQPLAAGHTLTVRLTEQNKKGKWRFEVTDLGALGAVVQGEPPPDAAVGQTLQVVVIRGAARSNIEAKWVST